MVCSLFRQERIEVMGSFNVACSVSHLSIDCGDPTVFIPLTSSQYREYQIGDKNHHLIGSECFYEPLTLPIFGKYDDYGRIAPNEDTNTTFLKHLGINIEDLIDPMSSDKAELTCGMFVHKTIYDAVKDKVSLVSDSGTKYLTKTSIKNEYERYVDLIKDAQSKANRFQDSSDKRSLQDWVKTWMAGSDHMSFNFRNWRKFRQIYNLDVVHSKILKKELIDFVMFSRGMYSSNRFFFPAMNGWQFGNPWATKLIDQVSLKVSREKIKEQEEE